MLKKLTYLLDKKQKKNFIFIFFVMFISLFLEMLSISLIFPTLNLVLDPSYLARFKDLLPPPFSGLSDLNYIYYILGFLLFLYFLKTIVLLFIQIRIAKFATDIGRDTSKKVFNFYLKQNYLFYTNNNSSKIVRNSMNEASSIFGFIFHFNTFLIEFLVLVGIICVLLFLQPIPTIILSIFILSLTFFYIKFNKKKVKEIGNVRIFNDGLKIKHIQHGINLIKEIKLYKKVDFFLNSFSIPNHKSFEALKILRIIQALPRLLLEQMVVIFIVLLVAILKTKGLSFVEIVPIAGLFAAAILRILPSSARIITSFQGFMYNYVSVKHIYDELNNFETQNETKEFSSEKMNFKENIIIKNLSFIYPGTDTKILENFNCEIKKNTVTAFVGKSGVGKSTLANIILGLIEPSSGLIEVDGTKISDNLSKWQKSTAFVPQSINLLDDSILKNIAFGVENKLIDIDLVKKCLDMVELTDFIKNSPKGLDTPVGEKGMRISGGQIQRIGLARALYRKPSLLILDEATNALDDETEKSIIDTIYNLKNLITTIIVTHKQDNIKASDKIILFDRKI